MALVLTVQNLTEALSTDYERVSRLAVFLDQAEADTEAYRPQLTLTNSKLRGLLCWLEQASLALCQPINYCLTTRASMLSEARSLDNTALIDTRNFLICREAGILLDDMVAYYEEQLINYRGGWEGVFAMCQRGGENPPSGHSA